MDNTGTYALVILSKDRFFIPIGKLGKHDLPSDYYIYVGSALSSLNAIVKHHMKEEKAPHWHIDYIYRCAFRERNKAVNRAS